MHLLKRHPVPIVAHFEWVVVLTYALPEALLRPLLSPRLELDTWNGLGFMAVALVQTRRLRPAGMPRVLGQDFFLSGYRIFTRLDGLRGLQILRSDTDRRRMVVLGNLLTHYGYHLASVQQRRSTDCLEVEVRTPGGVADLHVGVAVAEEEVRLPPDSPFDSWQTARRFAGPLPHTFSYEAETKSIVVVRGVRQEWQPRPVLAEVRICSFVPEAAVLASAFSLEGIPYRWERGRRV